MSKIFRKYVIRFGSLSYEEGLFQEFTTEENVNKHIEYGENHLWSEDGKTVFIMDRQDDINKMSFGFNFNGFPELTSRIDVIYTELDLGTNIRAYWESGFDDCCTGVFVILSVNIRIEIFDWEIVNERKKYYGEEECEK